MQKQAQGAGNLRFRVIITVSNYKNNIHIKKDNAHGQAAVEIAIALVLLLLKRVVARLGVIPMSSFEVFPLAIHGVWELGLGV